MITQQLLKEYLEYRDGHLWWIKKRQGIKVGQRYGSNNHGYIRGGFFGKHFYEHRLIWLYHYGKWPMYIDHINGDRSDNRIENLRVCTQQQNTYNTRARPLSTSTYKGVHFRKDTSKWVAQYTHNGKNIHIGCFNNEKDASNAYKAATEVLHKDFANEQV